MGNFEKPMFKVVEFQVEDIITTSTEHDNGFFDVSDFLKMIL